MTVTIKEPAGRARLLRAAVSRALMNNPVLRAGMRNLIVSLSSQPEYKPDINSINFNPINFAGKKTKINGVVLREAVDCCLLNLSV